MFVKCRSDNFLLNYNVGNYYMLRQLIILKVGLKKNPPTAPPHTTRIFPVYLHNYAEIRNANYVHWDYDYQYTYMMTFTYGLRFFGL